MCSRCFTIKMIPLCAIPTLWMVCISAQLFLRYYAITNRYITSLVMNKASNTTLNCVEVNASHPVPSLSDFGVLFPIHLFVLSVCLDSFVATSHVSLGKVLAFLKVTNFDVLEIPKLHIVECCSLFASHFL